jgi:hypothetical protein
MDGVLRASLENVRAEKAGLLQPSVENLGAQGRSILLSYLEILRA